MARNSELFQYNRAAWDAQVDQENRWTVGAPPEAVASAREGNVSVLLTPTKPVPERWFEPLRGKNLLCLASGGGQQGPLFAAAGAHVTVFDASPRQLAQDRMVADREGLPLRTVEGDMRDLHPFDDETFDLIFHPCSNSFVDEILPVWQEAFRVLRPSGRLLAGVAQPFAWVLDPDAAAAGRVTMKYPTRNLQSGAPHRDLLDLTPEDRTRYEAAQEPLGVAHSLTAQLGGQLRAGFQLLDLYEDNAGEESDENKTMSKFFDPYLATLALRPES
ncbi:MAG: class I SAM-dependent methyltransferase [Myxococcota bacterium]